VNRAVVAHHDAFIIDGNHFTCMAVSTHIRGKHIVAYVNV
jgi:hypothetical protein